MTDTTPTRPSLTLDVKKYDHYLAQSDLSDAEKQEFLNMMWTLVCEFVAFGFTVQDAENSASKEEKTGETMSKSTLFDDSMLQYACSKKSTESA